MKYEVVVIGSGAGGGTVAYNLAEAGINTLMLESGRHYDPRTVPWFALPN
ncbi:MAG: FAD-binding protein [Gammaproteobacteria bacterium]|nr:FAD-binding protein [Gammaproteobacteria bacterium]